MGCYQILVLFVAVTTATPNFRPTYDAVRLQDIIHDLLTIPETSQPVSFNNLDHNKHSDDYDTNIKFLNLIFKHNKIEPASTVVKPIAISDRKENKRSLTFSDLVCKLGARCGCGNAKRCGCHERINEPCNEDYNHANDKTVTIESIFKENYDKNLNRNNQYDKDYAKSFAYFLDHLENYLVDQINKMQDTNFRIPITDRDYNYGISDSKHNGMVKSRVDFIKGMEKSSNKAKFQDKFENYLVHQSNSMQNTDFKLPCNGKRCKIDDQDYDDRLSDSKHNSKVEWWVDFLEGKEKSSKNAKFLDDLENYLVHQSNSMQNTDFKPPCKGKRCKIADQDHDDRLSDSKHNSKVESWVDFLEGKEKSLINAKFLDGLENYLVHQSNSMQNTDFKLPCKGKRCKITDQDYDDRLSDSKHNSKVESWVDFLEGKGKPIKNVKYLDDLKNDLVHQSSSIQTKDYNKLLKDYDNRISDSKHSDMVGSWVDSLEGKEKSSKNAKILDDLEHYLVYTNIKNMQEKDSKLPCNSDRCEIVDRDYDNIINGSNHLFDILQGIEKSIKNAMKITDSKLYLRCCQNCRMQTTFRTKYQDPSSEEQNSEKRCCKKKTSNRYCNCNKNLRNDNEDAAQITFADNEAYLRCCKSCKIIYS